MAWLLFLCHGSCRSHQQHQHPCRQDTERCHNEYSPWLSVGLFPASYLFIISGRAPAPAIIVTTTNNFPSLKWKSKIIIVVFTMFPLFSTDLPMVRRWSCTLPFQIRFPFRFVLCGQDALWITFSSTFPLSLPSRPLSVALFFSLYLRLLLHIVTLLCTSVCFNGFN